jgi:hypothetical protein
MTGVELLVVGTSLNSGPGGQLKGTAAVIAATRKMAGALQTKVHAVASTPKPPPQPAPLVKLPAPTL